jgi:hypothetical protein
MYDRSIFLFINEQLSDSYRNSNIYPRFCFIWFRLVFDIWHMFFYLYIFSSNTFLWRRTSICNCLWKWRLRFGDREDIVFALMPVIVVWEEWCYLLFGRSFCITLLIYESKLVFPDGCVLYCCSSIIRYSPIPLIHKQKIE